MRENTNFSRPISWTNKTEVREFYLANFGKLYGLAFSKVFNADTAFDIVQEVFLSFLKHAGQISQPLPYLASAIRKRAYSARKSNTSFPSDVKDVALLNSLPTPAKSAWENLENRDETTQLIQALKQLPEENREVVMLHIYQDMTFEAMANLLECSANTLSARYYAALKKLESLLR